MQTTTFENADGQEYRITLEGCTVRTESRSCGSDWSELYCEEAGDRRQARRWYAAEIKLCKQQGELV